MSWAKLDDGFWMHPKILYAGNTAAGIFARMLSYCGCYLTDGKVPDSVAATIVGGDKRALARLEECGLIEITGHGTIFIPGYLEKNPTRDMVEEQREKRSEAGRKGGRASRNGRAVV